MRVYWHEPVLLDLTSKSTGDKSALHSFFDFSQQNQSKKKFFLRLRWYKPLLKFVLFTLMYWITKPGFLEYWWVFSLSGPTVPFIFGRLGIPIFGNKVIPRWLWHTPTNHFSPVSFSGRKWFTSSWTALHWHRARPTDRREDLALQPAAPSLALRLSFFLPYASSAAFSYLLSPQFIF